MIEMSDLRELDADSIKKLIGENENENTLEFVIIKERGRYSDPLEVAVEYLHAAYAGQNLSEVSTDFEYDSVTPDDNRDFYFKIKYNEIDEVAERLLDISYLFVNDHPDEEFIAPEETEWLLQNIEQKDIIAVCPDFIDLYYEFLPDEVEDERNK